MCPGHCCRYCLSSAEKPAGQPGQLLQLCHLASQSSAVHPGWVFPCGLLPAPFLFCCESFLCPSHCACGSVSRDVLWQWYWRESKSYTWCRRAKKPTSAHRYRHKTCLWLDKGFSPSSAVPGEGRAEVSAELSTQIPCSQVNINPTAEWATFPLHCSVLRPGVSAQALALSAKSGSPKLPQMLFFFFPATSHLLKYSTNFPAT